MVCQSCIKTVIYNVSTYWSSSAIVGVYLAPQGSYLTSAYYCATGVDIEAGADARDCIKEAQGPRL